VSKIYKMVRFVRLARLAKGIKKMKNSKNMKLNLKIDAATGRLGMFAGTLVIGIHCFTSFWLAMSQFDYENNWLANKLAVLQDSGEDINIETAESQIRVYFLALYFVMQTITTVGYGDVNP